MQYSEQLGYYEFLGDPQDFEGQTAELTPDSLPDALGPSPEQVLRGLPDLSIAVLQRSLEGRVDVVGPRTGPAR